MIVNKFPRGVKIYTDQISGLMAASVTNTPGSLTISWAQPSSKLYQGVAIVVKAGSYPNSPTDGVVTYVAKGTLTTTVTGLTGGTTYYVRAFAKATNTSGSKVYYNTSITGAQTTKVTIPNVVIGLAASAVDLYPDRLNVSWTAPSGAYSNVMIRYKAGSYPTSPTDGTQAYLGAGTSATITGLSGGRPYFVRAFVVNSSGEYNTNASQQVTRYTVCTPITLSLSARTASSITVSWNATSDDARAIYLVRKAGSFPTSISDGTQIYVAWNNAEGTVVDSGLSQSTQYYYRAFLHNYESAWNTNTSQQLIAVTKVAAGQVVFTSSQTYTIPSGVNVIDIFCAGGGGGGGYSYVYGDDLNYGGAGAGGYTASKLSQNVLSGQLHSVVVGAGGAGGYNNGGSNASKGVSGGVSSFGSLLSAAGGGGHSSEPGSGPGTGGRGGSGGGNGWYSTPGEYTESQNGYSDGAGSTLGWGSGLYYNFGQGSTTKAFAESGNTLYSGGGGGGNANTLRAGGAGGGGNGGTYYSNGSYTPPLQGSPNTAGGGGASGGNGIAGRPGAAGGSGIVIIRWGEQ
jgi:hypothetical protein